MEQENVIEIEHLTKTYRIYNKPVDRLKETLSLTKKTYSRDFHALNDVSFSVKKGENIGIIGTNGSGKSTILKIITGVLSPTSGNVTVRGKIAALLELGAGFNPEYTGVENIYLNGTMMGFTREEMDKKVEGILAFADIGDFVHQPMKTYSSGMFARLAFAVAINVEPEILIVDEALSVGDMRFQIKCMDHMKKMMDGGKTTILFVSHDTNAVRRFCSHAVWIDKGELRQYGNVNETVDAYLSFLKLGEDFNISGQIDSQEQQLELKPFEPGDTIAEIINFRVSNSKESDITSCSSQEILTIHVTYDVYEENVVSPVLGIALRSNDGDYLCGLNTLLDHITIPWKYGRNVFSLSYSKGICVVGGNYEFDVALFDQTASVPMQYISAVKNLHVISEYVGEGRIIIPHTWED